MDKDRLKQLAGLSEGVVGGYDQKMDELAAVLQRAGLVTANDREALDAVAIAVSIFTGNSDTSVFEDLMQRMTRE